jgi:hypothetical protein
MSICADLDRLADFVDQVPIRIPLLYGIHTLALFRLMEHFIRDVVSGLL